MSPSAGMMLLQQILPLIARAIARGAVKPVGCEDSEELQAEGQAIAAGMVDRLETKGKIVAPSSVAFYALQALKSGRRSGYAGRMDAMCPAATLDRAVQVKSMDAVVGADEDHPNDDLTLHDYLASTGEDVDAAAARRMDWGDVLADLDDRRVLLLRETAAGHGPNDIAKHLGVSAPRVIQLRQACGRTIEGTWGDDGIADSVTPSKWRAGLRAVSERRAGRAERRA